MASSFRLPDFDFSPAMPQSPRQKALLKAKEEEQLEALRKKEQKEDWDKLQGLREKWTNEKDHHKQWSSNYAHYKGASYLGASVGAKLKMLRRQADEQLELIVDGRGNRADQQKIIAEYAHLAEGAGQKCLTYEKEVADSIIECEVKEILVREFVLDHMRSFLPNLSKGGEVGKRQDLKNANLWPTELNPPFWIFLGRACQDFIDRFKSKNLAHHVNETLWKHILTLQIIEASTEGVYDGHVFSHDAVIMSISNHGRDLLHLVTKINRIVAERPKQPSKSSSRERKTPHPTRSAHDPRDLLDLPDQLCGPHEELLLAIRNVAHKYGTLLGLDDDLNETPSLLRALKRSTAPEDLRPEVSYRKKHFYPV
ncbi:hypothetical protein JCM5353_008262 [Sporobolomyces roseus]